MSGESDFYASGQWNFYCDLCGKKAKSSIGVKTWNGLRVCAWHKEVRNPQDFVRGVKDDQSVPWSRSKTLDTFVRGNFNLLQENGSLILTNSVVFVLAQFRLLQENGSYILLFPEVVGSPSSYLLLESGLVPNSLGASDQYGSLLRT